MAGEIENYLRESLRETIEEEKKNLPKAMAKLEAYIQDKSPSREKLYALNNLLTEWQRESKNCKSISWQKLSWSLTRNLKKLQDQPQSSQETTTQTREVQESEEQQVTANPEAETEGHRWSSRTVDPKKVRGLDEKSMSLQRLLVSTKKTQTNFNAIAIVGMRGIGKTTLAQLLFSMQELKSHFLPRIWVCLSKKPDDLSDPLKEMVKRMLICLGLEDTVIKSADDNHGLRGLLFALRLQLTGKRYLIVLDDVWGVDEEFQAQFQTFISGIGSDEKCGERLAYGLPKGECGGTVMVTTRLEKVAQEMVGADNVHRLPLSDDESCWKMFAETVVDDPDKLSQPLENLKAIILKKCAGLPLAAKMMGQIAHADHLLAAAERPQAAAPQTEIEPQED